VDELRRGGPCCGRTNTRRKQYTQ